MVHSIAWIVEAPKPSHSLEGIGVGDELLDLRNVHNVDGDQLNLLFGLQNVLFGGAGGRGCLKRKRQSLDS